MTWVYKMKRDSTQKARLCVQGCSQVYGVDYDQVWSGTLLARQRACPYSWLTVGAKVCVGLGNTTHNYLPSGHYHYL